MCSMCSVYSSVRVSSIQDTNPALVHTRRAINSRNARHFAEALRRGTRNALRCVNAIPRRGDHDQRRSRPCFFFTCAALPIRAIQQHSIPPCLLPSRPNLAVYIPFPQHTSPRPPFPSPTVLRTLLPALLPTNALFGARHIPRHPHRPKTRTDHHVRAPARPEHAPARTHPARRLQAGARDRRVRLHDRPHRHRALVAGCAHRGPEW